jgi:hypothetical protein
MTKYLNILKLPLCIVFMLTTAAFPTWALNCAPLKPGQPVDTDMKNVFETTGKGAGWLKMLGSVSIKDDYEKLVKEQKFENPDEANLRQSFVYLFCSLLDESSLSDKDKLAHYDDLTTLLKVPQCPKIQVENSQFNNDGTAIKATSGCVSLSVKGSTFSGDKIGIDAR